MPRDETNDDADDAVALTALSWLLADANRFERFQALTGLDRDAIRARIDEAEFLAAVLRHLAGHDPDLIAFAEAHALAPPRIVDALNRLESRCDRC